MVDAAEYDASHIQVLTGLQAIRKRPGMYVGSTGERGLHYMLYELADAASAGVLSGRLEITLQSDGGVRVADDGPGISLESIESFNSMAYVVKALSSRLTAEVRRDGIRRVQEYARGEAIAPPADAGPASATGTTLTFWPDAEIFTTTEFSFDVLVEHYRELAFLNRELEVLLADERPDVPRSARFRFPDGVREMVAFLDEQAVGAAFSAVTDVIAFELEDPRMAGTMEVALRWRDSGPEVVRGFANNKPTEGAHLAGFRRGLEAAVNAHARLDIDRICEGLTAVVSVKLKAPEFTGCTRGTLGNSAAGSCVQEAVASHLGTWFDEHPQQAAALIGRMLR